MKHIKKIACLQIIGVVFNCMAITTTANVGIMSGDGEAAHRIEVKDVSERIADIYISDEYTDTQKQLAVEKLEKKLSETSTEHKVSRSKADYSYTLDVPYEGQWEDFYCGPATTRQTLLFFGVSDIPDQHEIAEDLNVAESTGVPDADDMIEYINSYIPDEPPYAEEHPVDEDDMILSFEIACKDYGPPILRIKATSNSNWPYPTDGHYLNVSGAYKSGSYYSFELTDPYIEWVKENPSGKYCASASDVYDVVMTHWFGGYWW